LSITIDTLIGLQFGDEGKGRITNFLSYKYDIIARYSGGNNAGHTIVIGNKIFKLHLLPSGIILKNKINILGSNMVINPISLVEEINFLRKEGIEITPSNLKISQLATLIIPLYPFLDSQNEKVLSSKKIGTTGKGIGIAYEDKAGRRALRVHDILFSESFENKLNDLWKITKEKLKNKDLNHDSLKHSFLESCEVIKPFIENIYDFLHKGNSYSILAEGAQGAMLDINYGSYPMVTSSDVFATGALSGLGLNKDNLNNVIGIAKAFQTRVGQGAFPTEIFEENIINILRGDGTHIGDEYGTTTGRARRIGWIDLPML